MVVDGRLVCLTLETAGEVGTHATLGSNPVFCCPSGWTNHPQSCKSLLILEVRLWSPHKQHTPSFSSYLISTTHWQCLTHKSTETWTNQRWKYFSFTNMIMKMHPLLVRYNALSKDSFSGVNQLQTDVYIAFTKTCVLSVELHVLDAQCMRALTNYEIRIC